MVGQRRGRSAERAFCPLRSGAVDVDLEGTSVVSWIALAVSAVSLVFGVLLPWWQKRRAHPEARLELLSYQTEQGWTTDRRLVIVNHGPALMRSVNIGLLDENGEQGRSHSLWPPMPIRELHVGQVLHLTLLGVSETSRPARPSCPGETDV